MENTHLLIVDLDSAPAGPPLEAQEHHEVICLKGLRKEKYNGMYGVHSGFHADGRLRVILQEDNNQRQHIIYVKSENCIRHAEFTKEMEDEYIVRGIELLAKDNAETAAELLRQYNEVIAAEERAKLQAISGK